MLAKKEEVVIIGGTAVKKETTVLATEEGIIALEITSVESQLPQSQHAYLPSIENQQPQQSIRYVDAEPEGCLCCENCYCFKCNGRHKWYSLKGKGPCVVMLLILMYIILFTIGLPLAILLCICVICFCPDDD